MPKHSPGFPAGQTVYCRELTMTKQFLSFLDSGFRRNDKKYYYILASLFSFKNELSVKRMDSSNPTFGSQFKRFLAFSMLGLRV
jgi:hypothetical protein